MKLRFRATTTAVCDALKDVSIKANIVENMHLLKHSYPLNKTIFSPRHSLERVNLPSETPACFGNTLLIVGE